LPFDGVVCDANGCCVIAMHQYFWLHGGEHPPIQDVTTVNIDCFGLLRNWIHEASNEEEYWNQLVARLLNPRTPLPERPEAWGPLPSRGTQ